LFDSPLGHLRRHLVCTRSVYIAVWYIVCISDISTVVGYRGRRRWVSDKKLAGCLRTLYGDSSYGQEQLQKLISLLHVRTCMSCQ
jgi:hypothetical protein